MKKYYFILLLIFFSSTALYADNKSAGMKRFIIAVGANYGGYNRVRLKYAVSDANAFIEVFQEIGGADKENCFPLYNPDPRIFFSTMNKVKKTVASAKKKYRKTELIFYYSGHSDETGILLGNDKVLYKDIKRLLESIPADVRITILDSCSSGAFTRQKGGQMQPSFLFDTSYDMKGNAVMTSSSSNEVSQESDAIKGSYFTYYLITGLRGAADVTQDNRITLNEAYQYAFNNTLMRTEKSIGGAQHPNYNIKMVGTGDVILTDIRKSSSKLILAKNVYGTVYIRDNDNNIVAEFVKPLGSEMIVALNSGKYNIVLFRDNRNYAASIFIPANSAKRLSNTNFTLSTRENAAFRGDNPNQNSNPPEESKPNEPNSDSLFGNQQLSFSGYGAIINTFGKSVEGNFLSYSGLRGGLLINNRLCLGMWGIGLINSSDRDEFNNNTEFIDTMPKFHLGSGGFLVEYYFRPEKIVNISLGLGTGMGALTLSDTSYDSDGNSDEQFNDVFFAMRPEISVYIKVTRWCRIGLSAAYLYTHDVEKFGFKDSDFRGFSAGFTAAFGWF